MTWRFAEPALYGIALVASLSGVWTLSHERFLAPPVTAVASLGIPAPVRPDSDARDEAVVTITDDDLFRAERSAPDESAVVAVGQPMPVRPPKPALSLRGILGGPPWDALIEGLPGHEGAVVLRAGQRISDITVRAIRRDTVFLQGMDTTWKLTLRRQ
jgi:hypothetical protein